MGKRGPRSKYRTKAEWREAKRATWRAWYYRQKGKPPPEKPRPRATVPVPADPIRVTEAAHRMGVHVSTISKWARCGYFRIHRIRHKAHVDWEEVMRNRLMRQELDQFHARLEREADDPLPKREAPIDPMRVEPAYSSD